MDICPVSPDEMADFYVVGHLSEEQRMEYERHLSHCARCALLVAQSRAFRDALRAAIRDTQAD